YGSRSLPPYSPTSSIKVRDGNTEPKPLQSAFVDHLGPRRRLEREEPLGQPPVPAHVRERVAGAVSRLVEQLGPLDREGRGAKRQRHLGQRPPLPFRHEPETVRPVPACCGRRDERRRKEIIDAVAPRE